MRESKKIGSQKSHLSDWKKAIMRQNISKKDQCVMHKVENSKKQVMMTD